MKSHGVEKIQSHELFIFNTIWGLVVCFTYRPFCPKVCCLAIIPWLDSRVETKAGLKAAEKRKLSAAVANQTLITLTSDQ